MLPLIHGRVTLPEFQGEKSRSHLCCISHPAEENEFDWHGQTTKFAGVAGDEASFIREQSLHASTAEVRTEQRRLPGGDAGKLLGCPPGCSPGAALPEHSITLNASCYFYSFHLEPSSQRGIISIKHF